MAMRGAPLVPSMLARTLICVDGMENHDITGTLFNPYMKKPVHFKSIYTMLKTLDRFFNKHSFPYTHFKDRAFSPRHRPYAEKGAESEVQKYMSEEIFDTERGKKATFIVQVQFRQNSSWQGTITWTDEKKTQRFRSVLEMLKLMDNALVGENDVSNGDWE